MLESVEMGTAAVVPISTTHQLLFGALYLAAYLVWAWWCRSVFDAWARRRIGKWLGVRIVRVRAHAPGKWSWGGAPRADARTEALVGLIAVGLWLMGALLPIVSMFALVVSQDRIPNRLGHLLLLLSVPLTIHFLHEIASGDELEA